VTDHKGDTSAGVLAEYLNRITGQSLRVIISDVVELGHVCEGVVTVIVSPEPSTTLVTQPASPCTGWGNVGTGEKLVEAVVY